ncbi:uncharacterized protein LOC133182664 [Saccostrea echinata]|uniref:uncharacterized protein LOC133182664 n=1 Tax=Saccostrea echinata TaxID=191078 RepID=UPI002A7FB131|nr:uncharacterized protein LOC133182664 [Saccostrea echinata]
MPGEYTIKVDPNVTPVIHAPRQILLSLQDKVKVELDKMEANGVIMSVFIWDPSSVSSRGSPGKNARVPTGVDIEVDPALAQGLYGFKMADGGSSQNLVLVTANIDGTTYTALMSEELAELYRFPQCDPKTRNVLADAIRAQNTGSETPCTSNERPCTSNERPCISNERPCTSNETPVENESPCSSSRSSFSTPESTSASSSTNSTSDQSIHIWTIAEEKRLIDCRLSKEEDFCSNKSHDSLWQAITKELNGEGMKLTKQQIINKWKSLKKKYKEINDHNSKTGTDRMDWKHKEAFDRAYGNKASTKLSASFDTGRLKESTKSDESLKRKLEKGDGEEAVETKAELPKKKKIRSNLKSDLIEKLDAQNLKLMDQMETQHRDKLERMDRMLDLFERSLDKK